MVQLVIEASRLLLTHLQGKIAQTDLCICRDEDSDGEGAGTVQTKDKVIAHFHSLKVKGS